MSSDTLSDHDTMSDRDKLLQSWQYIAHTDFNEYAHWESINTTSNELRTADDKPATIAVVGQVFTDKLAVEPLGNFQTRQLRNYQDADGGMKCSNAKIVVVLKRPSAPAWRTDFDIAIKRSEALQRAVAKNNAQRLWFIDDSQTPPAIRLSFPLWDQKKYKKSGDNTFLEDGIEEQDALMREVREEHDYRANQTSKYSAYIPDDYVDAFRSTAKTHHIRLAPIFFSTGKRVSPDQYSIRLDNALVEVMFTLRHYYYSANKGKAATNTFTATIEQIRILETKPTIASPVREPTMVTIQRTPASQKGKQTVGSKRPDASSAMKESPTRPKKIRLNASSSKSTVDADSTSPASPSTSGTSNVFNEVEESVANTIADELLDT